MKKILKKGSILMMIAMFSCNLNNDLQNPNEIKLSDTDIELLFNAVELSFADFFYNTQSIVSPLVRQEAMVTGYRYSTAVTPQNVDRIWITAYRELLVNIQLLTDLAKAKKLTTHMGIAQALEAYTYITLVDVFGDVPQTEALAATTGNFNPKVDKGADVYKYAITLLDSARSQFSKTVDPKGPVHEVFYGGDRTNWTAFVNSIQLKAWMNLLPSQASVAGPKITALLALNLIDQPSENFRYRYSTILVPNSKHPSYNQYYGPSAGQANGYICNYFLKELYDGNGAKNIQDPRWRYYFYRQVGSIAQINRNDPKALGCSVGAIPDHYANKYVFCSFDPGFYGRDHGDGSGTPPDSPDITCFGVYPAGGKIDTNPITNSTFSKASARGDGANGAGILPIYMYFFTDFVKAEYYARTGDKPNAKTSMLNGINNSITAVRDFAISTGQALPVGMEPSTSAYTTAVESMFDASANVLDVIGNEFWIATWGNGIEAYNNFRRTSAPRNPQPTLQVGAGFFFRSLIYPAVYANLNSNVKQKADGSTKVFWDVNPDVLN